jgi:transposase
LENEVRGLLKTFGVMFGKRVGGFLRRAEEVIAGELDVAPHLRPIFEALVTARQAILARIRDLDAQVRAAARRSRPARLFMTAPGVGPITALSVATAFDDAERFTRSAASQPPTTADGGQSPRSRVARKRHCPYGRP